jgi:decaprenyl-phosphate phosphoribosyltransferase
MNAMLRLLRPKQWIKNCFVFAGLLFAGKFTELAAWEATAVAALAFLLASCSVYTVNDICDVTEDSGHPSKKNRPLASGEVTVFQASLLACLTAAASLFLLTRLPGGCAAVVAIYIVLNVVYTLALKRFAIIDVFFIAFCYVLRVLMGCYAIAVTVSPWIILATFLLALFLGFGKRYHEMGFEEYAKSKPNLQHYNRELLDKLVVISGGAALLTYAIYAAEVAQRIGKVNIIYTVAFVAFGLFRYLQSIYVYRQGGEPETIILRDTWQLANLALWLVTTLAILF